MTITYTMLVADKTTNGSIREWVNNSLIPSTLILTLAEQYIYQELRVREMLTLTIGQTIVGNDYVSLPANYRSPRSFWFSGAEKSKVRHKTLEYVEEHVQYETDGSVLQSKPQFYFANETQVRFEVRAKEVYPYRFWHYAAKAALASDNATNFLTERYALLLYYACAFQAYLWLRNEGEQAKYKALADEMIEKINIEADEEMGRDLEADIVAS